MKKDKSIERDFRNQVFEYLKGIDKTKTTPGVARKIKTGEGYHEVEERLLEIMLDYDMTIPQAINELEQEL